MSTDQVNYLNIGLVLASCALAFALPFELFLFSYAVLGPLHYLTEIAWLHQRDYFTKRGARFDYLFLAALTALLFLTRFGFDGQYIGWFSSIVFVAFVAAAGMAWSPTIAGTLGLIVLAAALCLLIDDWPLFDPIFGTLMLTLIHVCLFTAAFVLFGALKSRSASGLYLALAFLACGSSFFFYAPELAHYSVGEELRSAFKDFRGVSAIVSRYVLGEPMTRSAEVFDSQRGLVIARFIAFSYTYHYLNWFSKTSIIGWHQVSKPALAGAVGIWLVALGLYAYDFKVGLIALFFLSALHVLLEFPLNFQTFAGIASELAAFRRPTARTSAQ